MSATNRRDMARTRSTRKPHNAVRQRSAATKIWERRSRRGIFFGATRRAVADNYDTKAPYGKHLLTPKSEKWPKSGGWKLQYFDRRCGADVPFITPPRDLTHCSSGFGEVLWT